jgi:hypothetical protein
MIHHIVIEIIFYDSVNDSEPMREAVILYTVINKSRFQLDVLRSYTEQIMTNRNQTLFDQCKEGVILNR